jgi:hypothetical protein
MFDVEDHPAGFAAPWEDRLAGVLVARIAPRPSMHALDVGAGAGALTEPLVDALGIDRRRCAPVPRRRLRPRRRAARGAADAGSGGRHP